MGNTQTAVKKAAKKAVKKAAKKQAANPLERLGHDPKNREVLLFKDKDGYRVTKETTGFDSGVLSYDDALDSYNFQVHCSQNHA